MLAFQGLCFFQLVGAGVVGCDHDDATNVGCFRGGFE
jgi:hypothetical protein